MQCILTWAPDCIQLFLPIRLKLWPGRIYVLSQKRHYLQPFTRTQVKSVSVRSVFLTESWRKRIKNAGDKLFHCWCPLNGRVCLQGVLVKEVLTSYIKLFSKCFANLGSGECFDTDFKMSSQVVKFFIYIASQENSICYKNARLKLAKCFLYMQLRWKES